MADNLKVKASKAVDDARVAAHTVYDDASVAAHNKPKVAVRKPRKVRMMQKSLSIKLLLMQK
jgi:hypothetical protein